MKVELTMQSLGVELSSCCGKQFDRGETMYAVISDSGQHLGWWCADCVEKKSKSRKWQTRAEP